MSTPAATRRSRNRRLLALAFAAGPLMTLSAMSVAQAGSTPSLTLSQSSGPAGESVSVNGGDFESTAPGHVSVVRSAAPEVFRSADGDVGGSAVSLSADLLATFTTDSEGRFTTSVSIPYDVTGNVVVRATTPSRSAASTYSVTSVLGLDSPPPAGGYQELQPPGSWASLPNDAQAARMVRRSAWEPRPQNAKANTTRPSGLALGRHGGVAPVWNDWLLPRVTGDFTGTTDEIVQWSAAKWGLPDDLLRAQMISESFWFQGLLDADDQPVPNRGYGDYTSDQSRCAPGYTAPCPLSFGALQIKHATYHPGTFPHSRDSTAFNLDYAGALLRGCYEGWESWLSSAGGQPTGYAAGDIYGCVGRWYAGKWYNDAASSYITSVKKHLAARPWLDSNF